MTLFILFLYFGLLFSLIYFCFYKLFENDITFTFNNDLLVDKEEKKAISNDLKLQQQIKKDLQKFQKDFKKDLQDNLLNNFPELTDVIENMFSED